MSTQKPVRLLILGTGGMAGLHASNFDAIPGVSIVAGVDVDPERLTAYRKAHDIAHGFASLDAALEWGKFDAVANVTPDSVHHTTTLAALAGGKHVFCEKPLATNHADAQEMTATAEAAGLVNMVNLTYRNVAALQKARDLVRAGEIGAVRHVEASYLQSWLSAKHWGDWRTESKWLWRLSRGHGSNGVLGDIGIHILDFATYGAASEIAHMDCRLKTFPKAKGDQIGEYVLDANDSFVMNVEFDNGALGTIHASRWATGYTDDLRLRIFGEKGGLEVNFAFDPMADKTVGKQERVSTLMACLGDAVETRQWSEVPLEPVETNYQRFIRAIREGKTLEPSFAHATNLQRILDAASAQEKLQTGDTTTVRN